MPLKKSKGKLPIVYGNEEQVIPIYDGRDLTKFWANMLGIQDNNPVLKQSPVGLKLDNKSRL